MVTRMTPQKGFDLVQCVLDELMDSEDMAFVLLGTGNAEYEDFMRSAEWRHKGRHCRTAYTRAATFCSCRRALSRAACRR